MKLPSSLRKGPSLPLFHHTLLPHFRAIRGVYGNGASSNPLSHVLGGGMIYRGRFGSPERRPSRDSIPIFASTVCAGVTPFRLAVRAATRFSRPLEAVVGRAAVANVLGKPRACAAPEMTRNRSEETRREDSANGAAPDTHRSRGRGREGHLRGAQPLARRCLRTI